MVFAEEPGSDDICPVCFWQDDLVQLRWPVLAGGANGPSLIEAQENYRRFGAVEERLVQYVRPPTPAETVDPGWRRFDMALDRVEEFRSGVDYGRTYADDRTAYYYWRSDSRA